MQSDERLVRRAKKGDRRAFEAIFERYHRDLYRFCLMLLGSRQDAEEALQGTMVKLLNALPGEARAIRLRPWIYRIARNESIDILRRRRETAAVEPQELPSGPELAETVEARERLGRLIEDLGELPERQRSALVMRELGDLEFTEVGAALETSSAAARQAVYEARVSLRQMESGREMSCEKVIWELSEADGRVTRRREIQAHLRTCAECRAFRDSIVRRRGELGAIAPLPAAASAALLQGVLGAGSGAVGGGLAAGAGAGAGKALLGSTAAKTVATCAVVAAIGTTAADRSGVIDVPVVGDRGQAREDLRSPRSPPAGEVAPTKAVGGTGAVGAGREPVRSEPARPTGGDRATQVGRSPTTSGGSPAPAAVPAAEPRQHGGGAGAAKPNKGKPAPGLPASSSHGQQTAAAHKSPQANASPGTPRGEARGRSSQPSSPPGHSDTTSERSPPGAATAPEQPEKEKGKADAEAGAGKPAGDAESLE
jgi:RNA polymerase sigma factor (sigma-70 family)